MNGRAVEKRTAETNVSVDTHRCAAICDPTEASSACVQVYMRRPADFHWRERVKLEHRSAVLANPAARSGADFPLSSQGRARARIVCRHGSGKIVCTWARDDRLIDALAGNATIAGGGVGIITISWILNWFGVHLIVAIVGSDVLGLIGDWGSAALARIESTRRIVFALGTGHISRR